jgi:metal-responsive CopG/Arc/MetJ family transcriptional regulator
MSMVAKNLRLSDLARRGRRDGLELLSVRLPVKLLDRVDELVDRIGSGKAEVVVALLNEGLECYERQGSRARRRPA